MAPCAARNECRSDGGVALRVIRGERRAVSGERNEARMNEKLKSYKDLIVWQKSITLVKLAYQLTRAFPADEKFGLASQMRRAAVSVPSNL
jgi:hypothetical protein